MSNSKLTYRATPPAAFEGTKVDLTVTATNTSGADIKFAKNDEIQIAFPATMVDNQNFTDRKSTRLNSSHLDLSRMPSSA